MKNHAYLTLGEYYHVAILPTGVKKPKHKPSIEGAVGDVATAIIAKLRNEIFTSLSGLNAGILRALEAFNDKPFQKRFGSRNLIFENEEKPLLRALPMVSYEVCEWSYKHKVGNNSHIWWNKGQYSVPSRYIGQKVDVKYNNHLVYIYYNRTEIAKHQRLSSNVINGMRTDPNHLPFPLKKNLSVDDLKDAARDIGPATFELVRRMFDESKIVNQPVQTVKTILSIADQFTPEIKNAYFKYPSASLESLDYDSRQIKKSTIINLASMGFIGNATNLIITGPTGAGKTYLSCALGIEACKQTYRVLYIRMPDLMRNFENQRDNLRELTKYRKRIGNYHLLILDEWLNYKVTEKDAKLLYELFEQRSGNNPTIFVGQYPVDEWHERLGGGTQADSIMDRIIHNAYEIPTSETNLRKIYDTKKLKRLIDEIES